MFGFASIVGPALGGYLTDSLNWRWVFYVNLPFGLLGLVVLVWKYRDREKPHSTDLDLPGVALLGIFHDEEVRAQVADRIVDVTAFAPRVAA